MADKSDITPKDVENLAKHVLERKERVTEAFKQVEEAIAAYENDELTVQGLKDLLAEASRELNNAFTLKNNARQNLSNEKNLLSDAERQFLGSLMQFMVPDYDTQGRPFGIEFSLQGITYTMQERHATQDIFNNLASLVCNKPLIRQALAGQSIKIRREEKPKVKDEGKPKVKYVELLFPTTTSNENNETPEQVTLIDANGNKTKVNPDPGVLTGEMIKNAYHASDRSVPKPASGGGFNAVKLVGANPHGDITRGSQVSVGSDMPNSLG